MARAVLPDHGVLGVASTLSAYRFGSKDPTTRLGVNELWRATFTPDGPGTLHLRWSSAGMESQAWGPGASWLLDRVPALTGANDPGHRFGAGTHPAVLAAQRDHPHVRFGASSTLYHELLPVIIGQRITAGEAIMQWHRLVAAFGEPAPGPNTELRLPPAPDVLAHLPAWRLHPLGIERRRAEALRQVARHPQQLHTWASLSPDRVAAQLALIPGVGVWTIGSVLGPALGDADAVAVGDFHLKNLVVYALTGQPRGSDDHMLELLAPYAGQRGRVVRLLMLAGHRPPAFGPRQRILPMHRW